MKILHIPKYYLPHAGGIEDVCYNIVRFFSEEKDIEQQIICFNDTSLTVYDSYEGINVIRVGYKVKISSQAFCWSYKKELKNIIQKFAPDVIHFHAPNPLIAWYLMQENLQGIKLVVHWHSDIVAQKILYYAVQFIEDKLLRRADLIVATSPNYIEGSKPLQLYKHKVIVIQNIINPRKFEFTDEVRKKVEDIKSTYQNQPIVLFVGRHVAYKGLQYLLKAAGQIKTKCHILIGGSGPLTPKLKQISKKEEVHFIGRIPENELAAYYYAADIFVFPSVTKNEAFGVALAEAMYCESAAVTFTIAGSGVNWVNLACETGLEVPNKDVDELANAIERLLADGSLRQEYSKQAKLRVEKWFVIECVREKLKKMYLCDPREFQHLGR